MISVIIPCYNAELYIHETIKSILSQKEVELEIIVIDDGSTDQSGAIIKAFNDNRIRYIRQNNTGVSRARNHGLEYASGKYVIFFDADDIMSANFLLTRRKVLENTSFGFSCGTVITFPENSEETYGIADNVIEKLLTYQAQYNSCPSNYLINRAVLVDNDIRFNERLSSTADRFFLIELSHKAQGILIKESPLFYRVSPNSMSNRLTSKLILDNETYLVELKKKALIPKTVEKSFLFRINFILGAGFLRTGLYSKGVKYALTSFLMKPNKFITNLVN